MNQRQRCTWLWLRLDFGQERMTPASLLMLTFYQNLRDFQPHSNSDPLLFVWVAGGTVWNSASLRLEGKWAQLSRQVPVRHFCNTIINFKEHGKNITSYLSAPFSFVSMFRTKDHTGGCLCCCLSLCLSVSPPASHLPPKPQRTPLWIPPIVMALVHGRAGVFYNFVFWTSAFFLSLSLFFWNRAALSRGDAGGRIS